MPRLQADLETLAAFREQEQAGWTRRAFTPVYGEAREWLAERMEEAGLAVHWDRAGNLVGALPGSNADMSALMTGSHTDTVAGGGRFDGILGVLGGLEAIRLLQESGKALERELRLIDFLAEEPNDYGLSCVGSRALAGHLEPAHLELTAETGAHGAPDTLGDALRRTGVDPQRALEARLPPGEVAAFIELHVEQGPVLDRAGIPLAVVTGIAGIERVMLDVSGRPDHAGTTPMDSRRDALTAAAELILAVEASAAGGGGVATVGRMEVEPGAANVIPGRGRLWCEFRSGDEEWLRRRLEQLEGAVRALAAARDVKVIASWLSSAPPVPADKQIRRIIRSAIDKLGLPALDLLSGAGHDAAHMAAIAPMGMIFVPSRGGRSHVPEEHTDIGAAAVGVRALAQTLVELDRSLEHTAGGNRSPSSGHRKGELT